MIQYVKCSILGFKTHKSKIKNKREGAPQVKSKKGGEREGRGKAGRHKKEAAEI
jgi:hypothetical protein